MGEFSRLAERIAGAISDKTEEGRIDASELGKIARGAYSGDTDLPCQSARFNCYPGLPGAPCWDFALFLSLNSPRATRGRGHLKLRTAVEKVVQHMQGRCSKATHAAVLITDKWDPADIEDWSSNLRQISREKHLEIYLIQGSVAIEIPFGSLGHSGHSQPTNHFFQKAELA